MLTHALRVLIVDDSAVARQFITHALAPVPGVEIVGRAASGEEAVRMASTLRPDVITMDVQMPGAGGIAAVRRIMRETPTPILMVSSLTAEGTRTTVEALEAGALDFVQKPQTSDDLARVGPVVAEKVLQLGERGHHLLAMPRAHAALAPRIGMALPAAMPLVVVGSSTGGPRALFSVLPLLPAELPAAVIVVQHMPPGFTRSLAERLDAAGPLQTREADDGDALGPARVSVAPAGHHLVVAGTVLRLSDSAPEHGVRPSVDATLRTAAASYPGPIIAVILTGMGRDGTEGALQVRERGGHVIAESERTALIYGMPKSVAEAGAADSVKDLGDIAAEVVRLCAEAGHGH